MDSGVPTNNISGGEIAGAYPDNLAVKNQVALLKRAKTMGWDKEKFYAEMQKIMGGKVKINEAKHKEELSDEDREKIVAAFNKGKEEADKEKEDENYNKFKSNMYIWRTSKATSEKVKNLLKDFNEKHARKLGMRVYDEDAAISRVFISGDKILRKQIKSELESLGLKKVR